MFNGQDYTMKNFGVSPQRQFFFPMNEEEKDEEQIEENLSFSFEPSSVYDDVRWMKDHDPGDISGENVEDLGTKERYGTQKSEDAGLVGKDSITLNQEQSIAILKEAGYNADNCFKNVSPEDGTVSFQFGNEHVRVVLDSNTGKVTLLKTHIEKNKSDEEGESSKSVTTKFVMK